MPAVLQVKVVPGSSRDRIAGRYGEGIKVQVSAAPERGKANAAVIALLADWLGMRPDRIELISPPTNPHKRFKLHDLNEADLHKRIEAI